MVIVCLRVRLSMTDRKHTYLRHLLDSYRTLVAHVATADIGYGYGVKHKEVEASITAQEKMNRLMQQARGRDIEELIPGFAQPAASRVESLFGEKNYYLHGVTYTRRGSSKLA